MKKYIFNFLVVTFLAGISSCIKEHPDSPPGDGTDPTNISANTTIKSVKALSAPNHNEAITITQDWVIAAVVVADDQSGNFYQELALEDSTGGIIIMMSGSSLFAKYPIGRTLFIKLKDMVLVNNYGVYQLAGGLDNTNTPVGIPSNQFGLNIIPGKWGITVMPKVVTLSQLPDDALQAQLIEIDDVQVKGSETTHYYSSSKTGSSIAIESCSGSLSDTAVIVTSKYADFASSVVPRGNGKVVAIYSGDNFNVPQLILRDTSEINFYNPRLCD